MGASGSNQTNEPMRGALLRQSPSWNEFGMEKKITAGLPYRPTQRISEDCFRNFGSDKKEAIALRLFCEKYNLSPPNNNQIDKKTHADVL